MRITIFDGILEHHLHESLARALSARGHDVLATGKIGHGFRFPAPQTNVAHLERAVAETIAFEPEWVIVMRPASLPPRMLQRLRDSGARLTAWFSDDPVLFDLSYAPVVDQYDRILHCGTTAVLEHYERFFGRPTGVNLPFWTDHHAFPAVWGEEPPESRAMFLGNVHDEVRRRRYFDLARFGDDIRIHGKVGSDYALRGAGYLDTDAEVIAAGARTDWAINIPQRFADHRGLETWFPGLDELGFFEYPSRVVQTMAMGIPTISIIDGMHTFDTYPEMMVAGTVDDAIDIVRDPSWGAAQLGDRSRAVLRRFDRHFSAAARAVAIERFLLEDDWMRLDATARTRWFADVVDAREELEGVSDEPGADTPVISVAHHASPQQLPDHALVVSPADAGPLSRSRAVMEALQELGVAVQAVEAEGTGVEDAVARALDGGHIPTAWLVVVDLAVQLPPSAAASFARAVLITDLEGPTRVTAAIVASYDLVGIANPSAVERFLDAGFRNIVCLPRLITPTFARAVELHRAAASGTAVRVAVGAAAENAAAPGLHGMLNDAGFPLQTWESLSALGPEELAAAVTAGAGVIVPRGSRSAPQLDDLFVHVRSAVARALMPRSPGLHSFPELVDATTQFASAAELGRKAWRLETSPRAERSVDAASAALRRSTDAVRALGAFLRTPSATPLPGLRLASDGELLERGASCSVSFEEIGWQPRSIVRLQAQGLAPTTTGLVASVLLDDESVWTGGIDGVLRLAIAAPRSARHRLQLRFEYHGALQGLTPESAYEISATTVDDALPVPLHAARVRVLEIP